MLGPFPEVILSLRALAQSNRPSPALFGLLLHLVEQDDADVTVDELDRLLAGWPDACRVVPADRLEAFEDGAAWTPLVRALSYKSSAIPKKRLAKLMEASHLDGITHLDLRSCRLKWAEQTALIQRFTGLRSIALGRAIGAGDLPVIEALWSTSALAKVSTLSFHGWDKIKTEVYEGLSKTFPLENLRTLDLGGHGKVINAKQLKALVDTGRLTGLETLVMDAGNSDKWHKGMVKVITTGPGLPGLKHLVLDGCTAPALLDSPVLANLETLSLYVVKSKPDDLAKLVRASHLGALRSLRIDLSDTHDAALEALADPANLPSLDTLFVACPDMQLGEAMVRFLGSERIAGLKRFGLSLMGEAGAAALGALAQHAVFPRLEGLAIGRYYMTRDTPNDDEVRQLRALLMGERFPVLEQLIVRGALAADDGLRAVAASPLAAKVRRLGLGIERTDDLDGLWALDGFGAVEEIDLTGSWHAFDWKSLEHLAASEQMPALRAVEVPERFTLPSVQGREHQPTVGVEPVFTNFYVDHGAW